MKKRNWQPGDWVTCISVKRTRNWTAEPSEELVVGNKYEIRHYDPTDDTVELWHPCYWFPCCLFTSEHLFQYNLRKTLEKHAKKLQTR